MRINNEAYDILKWVTMIVLPATGTLYFALAQIWNLPYGEEIIGTIAAITTFMGAILRISTNGYKALEDKNADTEELDNPFGDYAIEEGEEDANS